LASSVKSQSQKIEKMTAFTKLTFRKPSAILSIFSPSSFFEGFGFDLSCRLLLAVPARPEKSMFRGDI
jgi:hypothetical protein